MVVQNARPAMEQERAVRTVMEQANLVIIVMQQANVTNVMATVIVLIVEELVTVHVTSVMVPVNVRIAIKANVKLVTEKAGIMVTPLK